MLGPVVKNASKSSSESAAFTSSSIPSSKIQFSLNSFSSAKTSYIRFCMSSNDFQAASRGSAFMDFKSSKCFQTMPVIALASSPFRSARTKTSTWPKKLSMHTISFREKLSEVLLRNIRTEVTKSSIPSVNCPAVSSAPRPPQFATIKMYFE
eukprot:UN12459